NESKGPYTFRISSQNYHRVGSLVPHEGTPPGYAQIYFYDTENELKNRLGCINLSSKDIDEAIVTQLMDMFDAHSAVTKAFRMARDWSVANKANNVTLKLLGERVQTQRRYDRPQVSEVAALVVGDFGETNATKDILIKHASRGLNRISEIHPLYMALPNPLLFPYGEDGFHPNIPYHDNSGKRKAQRGNVKMKEFYCYRIQQRLNEATTLLEAERLFLSVFGRCIFSCRRSKVWLVSFQSRRIGKRMLLQEETQMQKQLERGLFYQQRSQEVQDTWRKTIKMQWRMS
ncbi:hypothetical protein V2J09_000812, partial [Rumex salicifolius]